jgi:hypothetical protein
MPREDEEDSRVGNTTKTTIEFGPPKFQATIPEPARKILGATEEEMEYEKGKKMEKIVCEAEITVRKVDTLDLE